MLYLWIVMFAVWMMANATLDPVVTLVGAVLAAVLARFLAPAGGAWSRIRLKPRVFYHFPAYLLTFLVELIRANLIMMRYVYSPRIDIKPGIVKVKTGLTSPIGRLALTSTIALTPGSLVIDVRGDTLFIHWLDVRTTDVGKATEALAAPFERHLEKIFG